MAPRKRKPIRKVAAKKNSTTRRKPAVKSSRPKSIPPKAAKSSSVVEVIGTRVYVYSCISQASGGAPFTDSSILSAIPVRGDDVGKCLNQKIPLLGNRRFVPGEIDESWNVRTLITYTDRKRFS